MPSPAPPTTIHTTFPDLAAVQSAIVACTLCPRLRAYCTEIAHIKRAAYRTQDYWGLPVPGFGDPRARLLIVGLAPGAHGANRTGRMFTGDSSGDFLYPALHRAGFASQPTATTRDDGLTLLDAYITAAARCAPPHDKPTPDEFAHCRPFLNAELTHLTHLRVIVALGQLALNHTLLALATLGLPIPRPRPAFAHSAEYTLGPYTLLASYHPSQRNTATKLLTPALFDTIWARAAVLVKN